MERPSDSSLIIGVATSTADRVQLARLLGSADALLLVSSADQARAFLELTAVTAPVDPVVLTPEVLSVEEQPAQIEAPASVVAVPATVAMPSARAAMLPTPEPPELFLDVDRRV
ncbi:MAG TPA: hypothetical protein VFI00_07110, partial [Kribbella sp.]|nr:hypothetical protein [Kribbella sp.]